MSAGGVQALLISAYVVLPVFPLMNVRETELPILIRLIDARKKSLSLFLLRKMKKEFDDPGTVAVEMFLLVHDGAIPFLPNGFLITELFGESLVAEYPRVHPNHQHFLIIGTVENPDLPAFRKMAC